MGIGSFNTQKSSAALTASMAERATNKEEKNSSRINAASLHLIMDTINNLIYEMLKAFFAKKP
jgi:hypothetical protein